MMTGEFDSDGQPLILRDGVASSSVRYGLLVMVLLGVMYLVY